MGTHYYSLPTVDPDSTLSFPDAVNGLANATDAVLNGVQAGFAGEKYEPPIASDSQLGVVRVGKGFKIYSDGLLGTTAEKFTLKPATSEKLGGVYAGKNVTVDDSGRIGIGSGAFASKQVGTKELGAGAVTNAKLAKPAVTQDNLDSSIYNALVLPEQMWKSSQVTEILPGSSTWGVADFPINFRKLTDKIAVVTLHNLSAQRGGQIDDYIGKTVQMYTEAGEIKPGSLWTGKCTVVANIYGTSTGGNLTPNAGIREYILDFDNSTVTCPATNTPLYAKAGFATFNNNFVCENQFAILIKE